MQTGGIAGLPQAFQAQPAFRKRTFSPHTVEPGAQNTTADVELWQTNGVSSHINFI